MRLVAEGPYITLYAEAGRTGTGAAGAAQPQWEACGRSWGSYSSC